MTTILAQLPVERLGWVLIHSLWQFLAIALVVRLIERAFAARGDARGRYAVGLCGLAAMTVAPVGTWFFIPEAPSASAGGLAAVSIAQRREGPHVAPRVLPAAALPDAVSSSIDVMDQPPVQHSLAKAWSAVRAALALRLRPWLPIVVIGWLVGMSFCSLRPAVGWLTLRRLRTVGVSAAGQVLEESARRIAARLGITQAVSVWRSTLTKTPLVVGYLRPVLLIPLAMLAQMPLTELEAILAHELAHIRRHDFLVNLWQMSLETVFFYHPAVWSLSHRLHTEREHCCDDLALSVVGDRVCYGRALLRVEELRGAESLFALSAGGGSLRGRILRLFGQPSPPTSAAGLLAGVLLPSVALAGLLAAFACGAPGANDEKLVLPQAQNEINEQADQKPPAKPEPVTAAKPAPAARSLDIVIAQHVIVWDGRIRTWDEVVSELREFRKAKGKPIQPNFRFTNGANSAGHFETYQAKVFELDKELFQSAGVSFSFMSPRAAPRYDVLRKAEDLIPDPTTLRTGIVVEKGQPKAGVLVVLVPEEGMMPVMLKPDLTLRDPHDEVWTVTGPDGRFTLPVQPTHALDKLTEPPTYALAAISRKAYRLANIPVLGDEAKIELQPLAHVELTPVEGKQQRIDLSLRGGLPDTSPGFSIYEIEFRDKLLPLDLPAGRITIQRAFPHEDGSTRSYPAETVRIGPGESQKVTLPNLTEQEVERKWMEDSLRPKGDAKKQANQPGEKAGASLTIKFDIPGAEDVAKVAVRNVATDEYIGTEELWKGIPKYKVNSINNGGSFEFKDLMPGEYELSRNAETTGGHAQLVLDRQRFQLAAGEQKSIEIMRPQGKRIAGRIVNRHKFTMEYAVAWVCPATVTEFPRPLCQIEEGIDITACDADGSFTTAPVSPGSYAVLIEGYEPQPAELSGWHRPRFLGRAEVRVPEVGEPVLVEVTFIDMLEDIEWAGYVRGQPALRFIELLKPAWGKARLGIEFGVSHTRDQSTFSPSDRVPFAMFVRNVSDKTLNVELAAEFLANTPEVRDAKGNAIPVEKVELLGNVPLYRETLRPGEAFCFRHPGLGLGSNPMPGKQDWNPYWEKPVAGEYTLRHTQSISVAPTDISAPSRSEGFTSGTIVFDVLGN